MEKAIRNAAITADKAAEMSAATIAARINTVEEAALDCVYGPVMAKIAEATTREAFAVVMPIDTNFIGENLNIFRNKIEAELTSLGYTEVKFNDGVFEGNACQRLVFRWPKKPVNQ